MWCRRGLPLRFADVQMCHERGVEVEVEVAVEVKVEESDESRDCQH